MNESTSSPPLPAPAPARSSAIDLLRGTVMILMAIDHVRVFAGVPAGGADAGTFFTRWVTHFCAPVFVFLAGTSAFLSREKHASLPRHLLVRGLWLVLLELTFFRLAWTFNVDYAHYLLAGVIWAIGWSMVLLALLVRFLPAVSVGVIGVVICATHNLLDSRIGDFVQWANESSFGWLGKLGYLAFFANDVTFGAGGPHLVVLYSIVPWVGVMAAGYGFGVVLRMETQRRNRVCVALGLGMTAGFLVLRGFDVYGDPSRWNSTPPSGRRGPPLPPALFRFLNPSKYPASLQFLLMTLGPSIALIPLLDRARGAVASFVTTFGRSAFFFYLLHIPLIHLLAIVAVRLRDGAVSPWLFENHPMGNGPPPAGYTWSLPLLYLVWAIAIVLLWPACRWYVAKKKASRSRWFSFV